MLFRSPVIFTFSIKGKKKSIRMLISVQKEGKFEFQKTIEKIIISSAVQRSEIQ